METDDNLSAMPFRICSTARRKNTFRQPDTGAALVPNGTALVPACNPSPLARLVSQC